MHAIVIRSPKPSAQPWHWRFVSSNGKTQGNNESHPSRGNAIRAVKALVRAIAKPLCGPYRDPVAFTVTEQQDGSTRIDWS